VSTLAERQRELWHELILYYPNKVALAIAANAVMLDAATFTEVVDAATSLTDPDSIQRTATRNGLGTVRLTAEQREGAMERIRAALWHWYEPKKGNHDG
jgi:hypothetical protein